MVADIYKILSVADDAAFKAAPDLGYAGSPDDLRDGFIHLSTQEQLIGTLRAHYARMERVMLLAVDVVALDKDLLKWEPSRGGQLFPHYYAPLPGAAIRTRWELSREPSGEFCLPWESE